MQQPPSHSDAPYCRSCGFDLTGLTESSKCPECGKPLVEVLARQPMVAVGKRYRSAARFFGRPVIDVAFGPAPGEARGKARGIIAIGDDAMGWLAIGAVARGVVAIGGVALGVLSMGGFSLGLLGALGGGAIGGVAMGGGAVGGIATGGGALGYVAQGGGAIGWFARGGGAFGMHTIRPGFTSPEAQTVFDQLRWLLGPFPGPMLQPLGFLLAAILLTALLIAIIALLAGRPPAPRDTFQIER